MLHLLELITLCSRQLILILELYSPNEVYDYLRHIALTLCSDKVSEVRWISFKLVGDLVHSLAREVSFCRIQMQ